MQNPHPYLLNKLLAGLYIE